MSIAQRICTTWIGFMRTVVSLITGAAGDLGAAVARRLSARGHVVVLADLDGQAVDALASQLGSESTTASVVDVTDEDSVATLMATVSERYGRLTSVFHGAGIPGNSFGVAEHPVLEFRRTMEVNVTGTFLVLKHSLPLLSKERDSWVVTTASAAGLKANERRGAYAASKAAVIQLSRASALEYAACGVRLNTICPGPLEGRLFEQIENGMPDPDAFREQFIRGIAVGRIGQPDEVAAFAEYLLTEAPTYLTAGCFSIDGGRR